MADKGKEILQSIVIAMLVVIAVVLGALIIASVTSNSVFTDTPNSGVVTNETAAWLNETGYTLGQAGVDGFASPVITAIWGNDTGEYNVSIALANATVSDAGVLTNATVYTNDNVSVSYTYDYASGTSQAGLNVTRITSAFGSYVTNIIAFLAVMGTILGVLWLVMYVKRLFDKKEGLTGVTA